MCHRFKIYVFIATLIEEFKRVTSKRVQLVRDLIAFAHSYPLTDCEVLNDSFLFYIDLVSVVLGIRPTRG